MKKNNWFSHDSNARNDSKILNLRMKHGAAGYGVYFMILERLREETEYRGARDYSAIAFDLREDVKLVRSVIEDFGLFLFTDDSKYFYSESLNCRMKIKDEKAKKYSEMGKKSAQKRWGNDKSTAKVTKTDNAIHNTVTSCVIKNYNLRYQKDIACVIKKRNANITGVTKNYNKLSKGKLSKEKKSKDNINSRSQEANDLFERLWVMYPRKRGKSQVSTTKKLEILKVGEEEMVRAIERYKREIKGVEDRFILNGSTFFHGRYKDYLGDNYIPHQMRTEKSVQAGGKSYQDLLDEWEKS